MEESHDDGYATPKPPCYFSWGFQPNAGSRPSSRETSGSLANQSSPRVTEVDRQDSFEPESCNWRFDFWNEAFANTAPGPSRPRCPFQSRAARQNPNQQTEMTREDDVKNRFERPESPGTRQNCIRQYRIMQQRCLDHACDQTPCFDEACTFGMPQDSGCRYSAAFFTREPTSPCIWAWGKILLEHEERYGKEAAMTVDLEGMSQLYRERHERDQRFQGPALVMDPPNLPEGGMYYWVIRPTEQKGKKRGDTM